MIRQSRYLKVGVLGVALGTVLMAGAYAQQSGEQTIYHTVKLPGVDHHGNLNLKYGGNAKLKVVYDVQQRVFCAKGKATVTNYSCRDQVYYNRLAVGLAPLAQQTKIPLSAISITKDVYKVDRGFFTCAYGDALVCGKVTANPRPE